MFYILLALFIKPNINIKTSKHTGIISIFDKEFVKTGKIDKIYSKFLHDTFDERQKEDYRELVETPLEKAAEYVNLAKEFIKTIKNFLICETNYGNRY